MSEPTATTSEIKTTGSKTAAELEKQLMRAKQLIVVLCMVIALLLGALVTLWAVGGDKEATTGQAQSTATTGTQAGAAKSDVGTNQTPQALSEPTQEAAKQVIANAARRQSDDPRALGRTDAKVTMVLFSDFACPYCTQFAKQVQPQLQDLIDNGTLRIEWHDLAQISPTSPLAAQAGLAAAAQGKFWEFEQAAYASAKDGDHPTYTEESLVALAKQAGVPDLTKFKTDMNSQANVDAVKKSRQDAYNVGITGTPFAFIGDAVMPGYVDAATVRATVLAQAAKSGK